MGSVEVASTEIILPVWSSDEIGSTKKKIMI